MPFSPRLASSADPKLKHEESSEAEKLKAERKASRKAAKAVAQAEVEAAEALEASEKAARKAARKVANAKAPESEEAETKPAVEEVGTKKRKACLNDSDEPADAKQRRQEDGKGVATKALGASAFRKLHEIVVADSCPAPLETFDAAAPALGAALTKALGAQGYTAPTPIQAQSWPIALTGQDIVAVAKTGSGKTCGFLLPALARIAERGPAPVPKQVSWGVSEAARPSVLVLAPTRELALQIAGEAEKFAHVVGAKVVTLYGGTAKGPQVGACRKGVDILIATPGRLTDLCTGDAKKGLSPCVTLQDVTYLVLDEADQMLDMGFEPAIREIVGRCTKTGSEKEGGRTKRQTLFFSATWPKKVQAAAASFTSKAAVQVRIGQGGSAGDKLTLNKFVTQEICVCEWKQKIWKLKEYLKDNFGPNENAVIFAGTKGGCDFLEAELKEAHKGMWCRAIHGDKEQWEREEMLGEFRAKVAAGQQAVLVATDVAARGLDIPGISVVIVYDFSSLRQPAGIAVESFVHRVGRTGRAGKTGKAFTLWSSEDKGAPALIMLLEEAGQKVPKELKDMAAWERPAGQGQRRAHGWAKKW